MDYEALMEMAVQAGEIMLISGAEVYRVEDTIGRILEKSGLENRDVFVLTTGIVATLSDPCVPAITVVRRVSKRSTNLNRIARVNDISRRFCGGQITMDEARKQINDAAKENQYRFREKFVGYVMVTCFFAVLFSGGIRECAAAAFAGGFLALAVYGTSMLRLNDFCQNAAGSFVLALTASAFREYIFSGLNMDAVIISGIMPLVPGVTFTSAIRDTLNGDYSSGVARMAEAVVVALAVASGVGAAMMLVRMMGGAV